MCRRGGWTLDNFEGESIRLPTAQLVRERAEDRFDLSCVKRNKMFSLEVRKVCSSKPWADLSFLTPSRRLHAQVRRWQDTDSPLHQCRAAEKGKPFWAGEADFEFQGYTWCHLTEAGRGGHHPGSQCGQGRELSPSCSEEEVSVSRRNPSEKRPAGRKTAK